MKKLLLAIVLLGGFSISYSAINPQASSETTSLEKVSIEQCALFFFLIGLEKRTEQIVAITEAMLSQKKLRFIGFIFLEHFRIGVAARSLCDDQDEKMYVRYVDYLKNIIPYTEKSAALFHAFGDAVPKEVRNNTIYYFDQDYAQLRLDCINKELAKQTALLK